MIESKIYGQMVRLLENKNIFVTISFNEVCKNVIQFELQHLNPSFYVQSQRKA